MSTTKVLQLQIRSDDNPSDLPQQIIHSLPSKDFIVISAYLCGLPQHNRSTESADSQIKYFNFNELALKGSRKKAIKQIKLFCQESNFDIVIAHRFKAIDILLKINKNKPFKRVIAVTHGLGDYKRLYRKLSFRRLLTDNCFAVGVSEAVRTDLINAKAGFTETNTITINNAIDITRIRNGLKSRQLSREILNLPQQGFIFGTIGRLVPVKWHIGLIKAFQALTIDFPNSYLCIIGGGRLEQELTDYIKLHKLESRVTLAGNHDVASQHLQAFDTFVLPSLSEGLPLSLLEAMAAKLPVIGSNIPSITAVIKNIGGIAKVNDISSLSIEMRKYLLLTEVQLNKLGNQHYAHAKKHHSIEEYRQSYLDLISK